MRAFASTAGIASVSPTGPLAGGRRARNAAGGAGGGRTPHLFLLQLGDLRLELGDLAVHLVDALQQLVLVRLGEREQVAAAVVARQRRRDRLHLRRVRRLLRRTPTRNRRSHAITSHQIQRVWARGFCTFSAALISTKNSRTIF